MPNKALLIILVIVLSLYPVIAIIIRAKRQGYLSAAIHFLCWVVLVFISSLFISLAEITVLPPLFFFLGVLLLIACGATLVIRGVKERTDVDEMLMALSPGFFNPDLIFFRRFGKGYFHLKSILIGSAFILGGTILIFRKIF